MAITVGLRIFVGIGMALIPIITSIIGLATALGVSVGAVTIYTIDYDSCYGVSDLSSYSNRQDIQKVQMYVDTIDKTMQLSFTPNQRLRGMNFRIRGVRFTANNLGTIDTTYANRWTVTYSGVTWHSDSQTLTNNTFVVLGDSPNYVNSELNWITFTKNGSATTLNGVLLDFYLESY